MNLFRLLAIGLPLLVAVGTQAQTYPNDREKFVKTFEKTLSEYGNGDFMDFAKKELPPMLLESGDFSDERFSRMVATCNTMETKRLKVYPEMYFYVYSVAAMIKTNQSEASFNAWHTTVDKMMDSRNVKKIKDFVEFSAGFFTNGQIALASNFQWFYLGGNFSFEYDKRVSVKFFDGNLICRAISKSSGEQSVDSLRVLKTSGDYDPILKKWVGNGGTINWEKVGLDPTETFAEIADYDLSLKSSTIRLDTVMLTTPYFSKPIPGRMTDRAFKVNREIDKVYPQFMSFDTKLLIENLIPNIDYLGGFAMEGNKFQGVGTKTERAQITYRRGGKPFMVTRSEKITVSPQKVFVNLGEFSLYVSTGDSIYHPGIRFEYFFDKKEVQMSRSTVGIGEAPFKDSYHQLDVYAPKMVWKEGTEDVMFTFDFTMGVEQRVADFESWNYFNEQVYDRLQAMEERHPLAAISQYCYKYDEYVLTEGKAATALGKTVDQAKSTLLSLSSLGFINYDTETKMIVVNQKLDNFVKSKAKKKDYDNISIRSDLRLKDTSAAFIMRQLGISSLKEFKRDTFALTVQQMYKDQNARRRLEKNFAVYDMNSMDISLVAVDQIDISANKNVQIFPDQGDLLVKKNRNMAFKGWVNAGKLEIETEAAFFNYDEYKIDLQKTKEGMFRVRPLQKEHGPESIRMISEISGITGEILIDTMTNRSGNKPNYDHYPILKTANTSYVYYNDRDIFLGVYDSTRFYYAIDPFELDHLNNFDEDTLKLYGELVSAGIFPRIDEPLRIMQDYSFGFTTAAPEGGYSFYGTEAKYDNKIVLSRNGLQGQGIINFVNSTSKSNALTFLPDSTIGYANFLNRPSEKGSPVEFPDVNCGKALITYLPQSNTLKVASTPRNELMFFGDEATLRGTLTVRPTGMRGNGMMGFSSANLISDNFKYKRYDVNADTSSFRLKNQSDDATEDALAMTTDNLNAHVSFEERLGTFNANDEGMQEMKLPVNQYMVKMDHFKWFMDELVIEMEKRERGSLNIDVGVVGLEPNVFSTHPKQDSLQFFSQKIQFDVNDKVLNCDQVEYIEVADARIYPDSMKVIVRKKAKMDELKNAVVVASYITKYHRFEKASVQIKARRDYEAEGQYPYYDIDSNVTYISMRDIGPDTSYQTRASGKVSKEEGFKLSPEFDYYGDVSVRAATPLLTLTGATRINHDCEKFEKNWMAFTSEIDRTNIQIPVVQEMKDLDGNAISAGIVWRDAQNPDSLSLYPTFLSALQEPNDPIVITANGFLQYDQATKEFQIGSADKLINRGEQGNYIALHTESCSMNGDGVVNLGMDYGDMTVDAVGVVNYNQATEETSMNITARFNMPVDKGLMQGIADRLNEMNELKPMDLNSTTLEQAILEWDGRKEADKFKSDYVQDGKMKKVPDGLDYALTVTGLRLESYLKSGEEARVLRTNLETAILVNIYGKPVLKYVPFNAVFDQRFSEQNRDNWSIFIDIPGGRDYFMNYTMEKKKDGTLRIGSGDKEFVDGVNALKEDKRKIKNFRYEISPDTAIFMAKFRRILTLN